MHMKLLLVALVTASIFAGILSAASESWPTNMQVNTQLYQTYNPIHPASH